VLERGEAANSWRTERWDSLRLLTPNWLSRLPGFPYRGPDPDGYMTSAEVVDLISRSSVAFRDPCDRSLQSAGGARTCRRGPTRRRAHDAG
jgi:putative flavoprotein involved in K+ transport